MNKTEITEKFDQLESEIEQLKMVSGKKWFNYEEAAIYTGYGINFLRKYRKMIQEIDKKQRNTKVIFSKEELDKFIERARNGEFTF